MRVTIETLYGMQQSLGKLLVQDLPASSAFRLGRVAKTIHTELESFEENRIKLVQKYGEKSEDGSVRVTPGNLTKFSDELKGLMSVEVTLDFDPIPFADLQGTKLSALDMNHLEMFIKE